MIGEFERTGLMYTGLASVMRPVGWLFVSGSVRSGDYCFERREMFIQSYRLRGGMSSDRQSVPVSLPPELVERLDRLVEDGVFGSRSEALRYGARLVVREEHLERLHEQTDSEARKDVEERLDRKRVP